MRYEFPGKRVLSALIDVPLSVSPVVVGLALLLVYNGRDGWFGPTLEDGRLPGHLRHARHDHGDLLRGAAAGDPRGRAGARTRSATTRSRPPAASAPTRRQTFWRITLPSIKWAVVYGVVLSLARSLGEFGAVKVVSGNITGQTQTATLDGRGEVPELRSRPRPTRSSFLLAFVSIACIVVVSLLRPKRKNREQP